MPPAEIRRIAILGAGSGGCAAAADLSRRGFALRIHSRSAETLAPLRERGGVAYSGVLGEGFVPLPLITRDLGEAMAGADLVLSTVPTHAHEAIAAAVARHLAPEQLLMVTPGHTLLLVPHTLRSHGVAAPLTCETGTLPYICRMQGPAQVRITKAAETVAFAVFPARDTARIAALVRPVLPAIEPRASVLETVFPYTNAIHHPPATLCNAGRIEATGGEYYHYYDGISPAVGRLIDALDQERRAVGQALGIAVVPFLEQFFAMGYTTAAARASGLAYEAFHQSEPDRWILAPASFDHRFLNEDVPFGLVLLSELARLAGVAVPTTDRMIHLASVATGRDFRVQGLTLERMGLAGVGTGGLARLVEEGFAGS